MKRLTLHVLFLTLALAAGRALAQPESKAGGNAGRDADIADDMQTMATMLQEDLQQLFALSMDNPHFKWHRSAPAPAVGVPLAEHLPGQGVIIQMRIPQPFDEQVAAKKPAEPPARISRWERTERKLRGEAPHRDLVTTSCFACHDRSQTARGACPEFPKQRFTDCRSCHAVPAWHTPSGSAVLWRIGKKKEITRADYYRLHAYFNHDGRKPPTRAAVTNQVVDLLAKNGHNFRHLQPDEKVTISLSYVRPTKKSANKAGAAQPSNNKPAASRNSPPPNGAAQAGSSPPSRELAGDLLMQQQKYELALESYERAIATASKTGDHFDHAANKPPATLLRKLNAAYEALGRGDEGKRRVMELAGVAEKQNNPQAVAKNPVDQFVLEQLKKRGYLAATAESREVQIRRLTIDLLGRLPTASEVGAFLADESPRASRALVARLLGSPDDRPAPVLRPGPPSRITISTTKSQLDLIGGGKISREDFAQSLTIRIFDSPR